MKRIPVIAVTGYLGAGKTTVLNHLLRRPGARVGVVINDFGDINVDAGLLVGQIDEPASIGSGCICCMPDNAGLEEALERLSHPRLGLDAILVEASGVADPGILAEKIRAVDVARIWAGGVVDVVDAVQHAATVDLRTAAPARYNAATLVVVNKIDQVEPAKRESVLDRITARIRERNPQVCVVAVSHGRVDPGLVFDVASDQDDPDELPLRALLRHQHSRDHSLPEDGHEKHDHIHVESVTVSGSGPVDPGRVVDLLENPPTGVYRLKGTVLVRSRSTTHPYVVELVASSIHVRTAPRSRGTDSHLVAIGPGLDVGRTRERLTHALAPAPAEEAGPGLRRLQRHHRLSR